jgi:hypothetical protein
LIFNTSPPSPRRHKNSDLYEVRLSIQSARAPSTFFLFQYEIDAC